MKKFLILSLIALLVLAFGSMSFAQAKKEEPKLEFKVSGFIDAMSLYWQNVSPAAGPLFGPPAATYLPAFAGLGVTTGAQFDKRNSAMLTRGHLKFDVAYGKEMSGTIYFEMDSTRWGDTGRPVAAGRGETLGRWGGDETAVEIKNLFFNFAIPPVIPVPMMATVGLQPLSIRPKVFLYTDGTGAQLSAKVDPANISLLWFKALEGKDQASDDVDVYGLHANAKIGKVTVGGYGVYYNMNTYPVATGTALTPSVAPSFDAEMWWLGLYADGRLGPVDLNFDFVLSTGEVELRSNTASAGKRDVDYSGWIGRLKVDYPWEKFNFGVIGVYATGSDLKKTDASGLPGRAVGYGAGFGTSRKVGGYVVPPFSENFAFGDSIVITTEWNRAMSGFRTASGTNLHRGAFGGTAMAQAYASFKATPWYKVTLKGMYLWDTTENGNTIGNARNLAGRPRDDNGIGWELDLINEINIYKNLKWDIAGGVLFAGDALDYNVTVGGAATAFNKGPKNPYIILTRLVYTF
jgi:hypothetical protein